MAFQYKDFRCIFKHISLEYFNQQSIRDVIAFDYDYDYPIGKHISHEYFSQQSIRHVVAFDHDSPIGNLPINAFVLGSCHGLLCISSLCLGNEGNGIYLWNPSTRKSKKLPDIGKDLPPYVISSYRYGFGYDNSSNDYKVVVLSMNNPFLRIYSLKSDCWANIDDFSHSYVMNKDFCIGTFVNGKIYWFVEDERHCKTIIFVDIPKASCGEVKQPDYGGDEQHYSLLLGELRGCLSLTKVNPLSLDLWIMTEKADRGESWEKLAVIPLVGSPMCLSMPMCLLTEGEILMFCQCEGFELYNPKDDSVTTIRYPGRPDEVPMTFYKLHIYVESLVSLDVQTPRR